MVYPVDGGAPVKLCAHCAPPWGVDPIPFYIGWTPDSRFLLWKFTGTTYAVPLRAGRLLLEIPAAGLQSAEAVSALPGARVVSSERNTFPGPSPSLYAWTKVTTQRNIYRVPVAE